MKIRQSKQDQIRAAAKRAKLQAQKPKEEKAELAAVGKQKRQTGRRSLSDWLEKSAATGGRIERPIQHLEVGDRLIFKNSTRHSFARGLPAVFAETKEPPGRIFFSGSLIADEALQSKSQGNHKGTRFASFLDSTTLPLHLGSIDDMREAGLNNYFISMLIKPDKYAGDDRESILRIKVFYSLLVRQSPLFEKLQSFEDRLHSSYSKNEIKSALDDLLLSASALEKTSLVELLLSRGANPNARSWLLGVSAINVANNNKRDKAARVLVEHGANPNTQETHPMSNAPLYAKKFPPSEEENLTTSSESDVGEASKQKG